MKQLIAVMIILLIGLNLGFSQKDITPKNQDLKIKEIRKQKDVHDIAEIRIKEPILIKNADSDKKSFWDSFIKIGAIIGFFGGLLGLIVTGFAINDRWFKEVKVTSKIISFANVDGEFEIMKRTKSNNPPEMRYGAKYLLKLALNVTNKDLNYSDLEILIKYKKIDVIFNGEVYSPRNYSSWKLNETQFRLTLPQDKLLYYKTSLEMNKTHLEYLTFIVYDEDEQIKRNLKAEDFIPESIQIVFKNSEQSLIKKKINRIETNKMMLDSNMEKFIWEDEIWL